MKNSILKRGREYSRYAFSALIAVLICRSACAAPTSKPVSKTAAKTAAPTVQTLSPAQKKLHAELEKVLDDEEETSKFARIESLLQRGAPVNVPMKNGTTFLMMATLIDAKTTTLLLKHHADIQQRDNGGWTALQIAALVGDDPQVIRVLVAAGAKVN